MVEVNGKMMESWLGGKFVGIWVNELNLSLMSGIEWEERKLDERIGMGKGVFEVKGKDVGIEGKGGV